ncbi:hypothetical protein OROHE_002988 [Orobanche hederae]
MASGTSKSINSKLSCYCNKESPVRVAKTEANHGLRFHGCGNYGRKGETPCTFFKWVDNEEESPTGLKAQMCYRCDFYEGIINELKEEIVVLKNQMEFEKNQNTEEKIKYDFMMLKLKFFGFIVCALFICIILRW